MSEQTDARFSELVKDLARKINSANDKLQAKWRPAFRFIQDDRLTAERLRQSGRLDDLARIAEGYAKQALVYGENYNFQMSLLDTGRPGVELTGIEISRETRENGTEADEGPAPPEEDGAPEPEREPAPA